MYACIYLYSISGSYAFLSISVLTRPRPRLHPRLRPHLCNVHMYTQTASLSLNTHEWTLILNRCVHIKQACIDTNTHDASARSHTKKRRVCARERTRTRENEHTHARTHVHVHTHLTRVDTDTNTDTDTDTDTNTGADTESEMKT